jgi:hypothetical protein
MIAHGRFIVLACVALASLFAGCGSPLVGLECRDGLERCGRACYDLRSDESHCGGCNIMCAANEMCIESACRVAEPPPDAGTDGGDGAVEGGIDAGDGGDGGLDAGDGSDLDARLGDGQAGDGQAGDGRIGDGSSGEGGSANPDGSSGDAGGGDGSSAEGDGSSGGGDGSVGDGDGGVNLPVLCTGPNSPEDCVCDLGQLKCDDFCVDANTDRNNCGGCGVMCLAQEYCAAGVCAPICAPPLTLCGSICVNLAENDANCGSCGNVCGVAAACIDSQCIGSAVGHVVVIGHDMSASRAPMQTMVGNSVFLVRGNPLRVLAYDENTNSAARAGVSVALQNAALALGRSYSFTTASRDLLGAQLGNADALIIMTQHGATDALLRELGTTWSAAFGTFLFRGGAILLFDAGGANAGTHQILEAAGLLTIDARMAIPRSRLTLETPSDAVASAVPTEYQSEGESAVFDLDLTDNAGTVVVVRDPATMRPVVLHRVFLQP